MAMLTFAVLSIMLTVFRAASPQNTTELTTTGKLTTSGILTTNDKLTTTEKSTTKDKLTTTEKSTTTEDPVIVAQKNVDQIDIALKQCAYNGTACDRPILMSTNSRAICWAMKKFAKCAGEKCNGKIPVAITAAQELYKTCKGCQLFQVSAFLLLFATLMTILF